MRRKALLFDEGEEGGSTGTTLEEMRGAFLRARNRKRGNAPSLLGENLAPLLKHGPTTLLFAGNPFF